jgi:hypothetical protein
MVLFYELRFEKKCIAWAHMGNTVLKKGRHLPRKSLYKLHT